MARFRKKPVIVEARQLLDDLQCHFEIAAWIGAGGGNATLSLAGSHMYIQTLEGPMRADLGDWIIRGIQGEHYPCKPDIFEATYERVEDHE